MDFEQRELKGFIDLHGFKARHHPTNQRVAHLYEYSSRGIPLNATLMQYTLEDVTSAFYTDSVLVRWLIQQIQTYDTTTEHIVGLIFDKSMVLAQVIRI